MGDVDGKVGWGVEFSWVVRREEVKGVNGCEALVTHLLRCSLATEYDEWFGGGRIKEISFARGGGWDPNKLLEA